MMLDSHIVQHKVHTDIYIAKRKFEKLVSIPSLSIGSSFDIQLNIYTLYKTQLTTVFVLEFFYVFFFSICRSALAPTESRQAELTS